MRTSRRHAGTCRLRASRLAGTQRNLRIRTNARLRRRNRSQRSGVLARRHLSANGRGHCGPSDRNGGTLRGSTRNGCGRWGTRSDRTCGRGRLRHRASRRRSGGRSGAGLRRGRRHRRAGNGLRHCETRRGGRDRPGARGGCLCRPRSDGRRGWSAARGRTGSGCGRRCRGGLIVGLAGQLFANLLGDIHRDGARVGLFFRDAVAR